MQTWSRQGVLRTTILEMTNDTWCGLSGVVHISELDPR